MKYYKEFLFEKDFNVMMFQNFFLFIDMLSIYEIRMLFMCGKNLMLTSLKINPYEKIESLISGKDIPSSNNL